MKQPYIITIDMGGEDSVYFTEMTADQAEEMRSLIRHGGQPFTVTPLRKAPGFHSFGALMKDFQDFVDVRLS